MVFKVVVVAILTILTVFITYRAAGLVYKKATVYSLLKRNKSILGIKEKLDVYEEEQGILKNLTNMNRAVMFICVTPVWVVMYFKLLWMFIDTLGLGTVGMCVFMCMSMLEVILIVAAIISFKTKKLWAVYGCCQIIAVSALYKKINNESDRNFKDMREEVDYCNDRKTYYDRSASILNKCFAKAVTQSTQLQNVNTIK